MKTTEHQKLVGAIDHASHSLAIARESLPPANAAAAPDATTATPTPVQARLRAEVGHVARLLEEAREPGRIPPDTIDGAAHALDRELGRLAGRVQVRTVIAKVIETRVEERDGRTWITGLCPFCWERVAARVDPDGSASSARCSSGHLLAVVEHRSASED